MAGWASDERDTAPAPSREEAEAAIARAARTALGVLGLKEAERALRVAMLRAAFARTPVVTAVAQLLRVSRQRVQWCRRVQLAAQLGRIDERADG